MTNISILREQVKRLLGQTRSALRSLGIEPTEEQLRQFFKTQMDAFSLDEKNVVLDAFRSAGASLIETPLDTTGFPKSPVSILMKSDDGQIEETIDAQSYFIDAIKQGTLNETLEKLKAANYACDYVCDDIVYFMEDLNPEAERLLNYVQSGHSDDNPLGFEVYVNQSELHAFLENVDFK